MVQIVETIKLTVEETEWNKLEYFDSLYNKDTDSDACRK